MADRAQMTGAAFGLSAALLFGLSAPLSKLLLNEIEPVLLAGLLYLGGGMGLLLLRLLSSKPKGNAEAPLQKADFPKLAIIIFTGGMAGPVLMLLGLRDAAGVSGSLLLNLEGPLTVMLAAAFFGEHLGRCAAGAALLIFSGAALLGWQPGPLDAQWSGVLFLTSACFAWALDNNMTQRLSLRDPVALVLAKTFSAGACNLAIGLFLGDPWPSAGILGSALIIGFFSYGLSIVLDTYALRAVGAIREAAYFATAPFVGALAAVPLLGERISWIQGVAFGAMAVGVVILIREHHAHEHVHDEMEHEHLHVHDIHHQHTHEGPFTEPHSHLHRHARLVHSHAHVPDVHHRHSHSPRKRTN